MKTPVELVLPESLHLKMDAEAARAYPNECCGILVGTREGRIIEAVHTPNAIKLTHARRAFAVPLFTVLLFRRVLKGRKGLRILGFYHSHPNRPAVPSEDDLTYAWPGYVYLIVRVQRHANVRRWRAWALDDKTPKELPLTTVLWKVGDVK